MCIDKTTLDESFQDSKFKINWYQYLPFRREQTCKGGGKIVYIYKGLIAKRLFELETKSAESICLELIVSRRKWYINFAYRSLNQYKTDFFDEICSSFNKMINKYESVLLAGDLFDSNKHHINHWSVWYDDLFWFNWSGKRGYFESQKRFLIDGL